eukprot:m51a1_g9498 putative cathepsin b (588) ;mRNA; f:659132-661599
MFQVSGNSDAVPLMGTAPVRRPFWSYASAKLIALLVGLGLFIGAVVVVIAVLVFRSDGPVPVFKQFTADVRVTQEVLGTTEVAFEGRMAQSIGSSGSFLAQIATGAGARPGTRAVYSHPRGQSPRVALRTPFFERHVCHVLPQNETVLAIDPRSHVHASGSLDGAKYKVWRVVLAGWSPELQAHVTKTEDWTVTTGKNPVPIQFLTTVEVMSVRIYARYAFSNAQAEVNQEDFEMPQGQQCSDFTAVAAGSSVRSFADQLLAKLAQSRAASPAARRSSADAADLVNGEQRLRDLASRTKTWTSGPNTVFDGKTLSDAANWLRSPVVWSAEQGSHHEVSSASAQRTAELLASGADVPESFDSRTQWPLCPTVRSVRNQGKCGSCWAHGAAEAFGDRLCVASGGNFTRAMSPQWMVSCFKDNNGCNGGFPDLAWLDLVSSGVATDRCLPYTAEDGQCPAYCRDYSSPVLYRTSDAYSVFSNESWATTARALQVEVMTRGPVEVAYAVFDDFVNYKSGVYSLSKGAAFAGMHAVKLIGWGTENGTPYWLVANSWGTEWGISGLFKIRRGVNEVGIEDSIVAGTPIVPARF